MSQKRNKKPKQKRINKTKKKKDSSKELVEKIKLRQQKWKFTKQDGVCAGFYNAPIIATAPAIQLSNNSRIALQNVDDISNTANTGNTADTAIEIIAMTYTANINTTNYNDISKSVKYSHKNTKPLSINGKDIPQKVQMIVFSFINSYNASSKNNIIMPTDLVNVIVLYYWTGFFYTDNYGRGIKFINGETVKMTERNVHFSTCLFGKPINNKIANKYKIDFQINSSTPAFLFGYVVSDDCIKNWNNGLGNDQNAFSSVGIYVGYERNYFELFDVSNDGAKLNGYAKSTFRNKDIFGLLFDFVNDTLHLYHNHYRVAQISLNNRKSVIPAISLMFENDSIDILKETVN